MTLDRLEQRVRTAVSLPDYFRTRLHRTARRMRLAAHDDTLWYLGEILDRFGRSDRLFEYHDGAIGLRPLALLYGDAVAADSERERCQLLQRLGDLALFLGAFFPDRYARRGIHRDYFVGMGGGAYDYLAGRAPRGRHVFGELTHQFGCMIELIAEAGSRRDRMSHDEVLRLYQRWTETRSRALAGQLRALGIQLPDETGQH